MTNPVGIPNPQASSTRETLQRLTQVVNELQGVFGRGKRAVRVEDIPLLVTAFNNAEAPRFVRQNDGRWLLEGSLDVEGTFRSRGAYDADDGLGAELYVFSDEGYLLAIDRGGPDVKALNVYGTPLRFHFGLSLRAEIVNDGITVVGTVADSGGNVRNRPVAGSFAPGYTREITGNTTVPDGLSVGAVYYVHNNSDSAVTLTEPAAADLRLGGTTSIGNRTLAPRGTAEVWVQGATNYIVRGDVT